MFVLRFASPACGHTKRGGMSEREPCQQCGFPAWEFREGVCLDCCAENQRRLDLHNAEYDRWQRMSDAERAREIRDA